MDPDDFQEKFSQIVEQLSEDSSEDADYWAVREFYEARAYFLRTAAIALTVVAIVVSLSFGIAVLLIAGRM